MTVRLTAMFALLFGLLTAAAPVAQAADAVPAPPPKPDFTPFAFLIGTWTCVSTETDRPDRESAKTTWKMDEKGYWLVGSTDYHPVKSFPYEQKGQERITFLADAGLWIYEDWRDMGGYNLYTTPGFTGTTVIWKNHSFFPGKKERAISTYTLEKMGDAKYVGTFELTPVQGPVVKFQDTCTKA